MKIFIIPLFGTVLGVVSQVEDMFRAGSDVVIPAAQWPTAKDDLEMDLVQMLKDKAANVRTAA